MDALHQKRPKRRVPRSAVEWGLELIGVFWLLFLGGTLAFSWSSLPARVPTHFGVSGQADSYGDKMALLALPVITVVLYVLLTALSFFPQFFNFPWPITEDNATAQYRLARTMLGWLKVELVAIFAYINWQIIQAAQGHAPGLGLWFLPVVLLIVFGTLAWHIRLLYQAR